MVTEEQLKSMEGRAPLLVQVVREQRQQIEQLRAERDLANGMHEEAARQRDDVAAKLVEAAAANQLLTENHAMAVRALDAATSQNAKLKDQLAKTEGQRDMHQATARLQANAAADAAQLRVEAEARAKKAKADGMTEAALLAASATLPAGYRWGADAMESFRFGVERAVAAIKGKG